MTKEISRKEEDMHLLAVDPGPTESAFVVIQKGIISPTWAGPTQDGCPLLITQHGTLSNADMREFLLRFLDGSTVERRVAVEMVACYGMSVGREVFHTCLFIGQMEECCRRAGMPCELIVRQTVKRVICHDSRAKDSNIRQAMIDRFGKPGTKKQRGITYGLKGGEWQALALAVTALGGNGI